ncbi:CRISPR-associated endonuclease Cas2 [uncultured Shewanella sp.]|uniref:CRISPR-associated endonuclease Cas2 n=1 Tax=uncultured Shewanella sp. TaxID=173975 RepID=UPI00261CE820|nr:CRISPR-associated endonuclease Cas2 [uncultured Shewanella sp.]
MQKSVYLLAALPNERRELCRKLEAMIDAEHDRLLWLPFLPNAQSFHLGKKGEWLIVHDDERLNGFVF